MSEYNEEDFLLLSGIQHFIFCRRQWALIHIEQQWSENYRTVDGHIFHEKAHSNIMPEKRGDIIISRSMPVLSRQLGVTGVCDVVEFHRDKNGISVNGLENKYKISPVEYKRGKPKDNDSDILQLVGQAICLEEMLCCNIETGYLYYGEIRHREQVDINQDLRKKVYDIFKEMHDLYTRKYTPKVKSNNSCKSCSLIDICLPKLCKKQSIKDYMNKYLKEE